MFGTVEDLKKIVEQAWDKDTCWPGCADQWTIENPSWGHCLVNALVVNDYFDVEMIYVDAILPSGELVPHYFNKINEKEIDLTRI